MPSAGSMRAQLAPSSKLLHTPMSVPTYTMVAVRRIEHDGVVRDVEGCGLQLKHIGVAANALVVLNKWPGWPGVPLSKPGMQKIA